MSFFIIYESFLQALGQLKSNILRSLLSLAGISIGVFCIISVLASISSLERVIKTNFETLGEDVLYIDRMPWKNENPEISYWKYLKRPVPSYSDFLALSKSNLNAEFISYSVFLGSKVIKYRSNELNDAITIGATYDYAGVFNLDFQKGRYYTKFEFDNGKNMVVIGDAVAKNIFGNINPLNKEISINGIKVVVIGVIKKSGESMFNPIKFDNSVILPLSFAKKMTKVNTKNPFGSTLNLKPFMDFNKNMFKDNVRGALRKIRNLKPLEEDNFAINELSLLNKIFDDVFKVFNRGGWIIGFFSLLVGGFGVANIMFVNVKERIAQIGLKKALGASRSTILFEFLFESILLCVFGGLIGLFFVFVLLQFANIILNFEFYMPIQHVIVGLGLSIIIGVISGILPAFLAARMDPIEAIRK